MYSKCNSQNDICMNKNASSFQYNKSKITFLEYVSQPIFLFV